MQISGFFIPLPPDCIALAEYFGCNSSTISPSNRFTECVFLAVIANAQSEASQSTILES